MKHSFTFLGALFASGVLLASPALAATDAPYKIGYISDITGPVQGTFKYTYEGFKLFVDQLNQEGGINGRKIEVLLKDVQSDTQKSVNAVHELKSAGVLGIAGLAVSSTHAATYAAAANAGIPVVAGFPPNLPIILEPAEKYAFGVGEVFNQTNTITGAIARSIKKDAKRIACVSFEAPGSIYSCRTTLESAKKAGFEAAEIFIISQNQRDYRAVASNIAKFKPDIITDCLGQSHVIGLLPALGAVGYKGIYLNMETAIGDQVKRDGVKNAPDIDLYSYGRFISGKNIAKEGPQARKLQEAASKAGIKEIVAANTGGWVLGQVIAQGLEKCQGDCASSEDFRNALEKVNVDTGGLTGVNVQFTETNHFGPTAVRLYHYNRGTTNFDPVGDWHGIAPVRRADK